MFGGKCETDFFQFSSWNLPANSMFPPLCLFLAVKSRSMTLTEAREVCDSVAQWLPTLVLGTSCPACFGRFPAASHLDWMNQWLIVFCSNWRYAKEVMIIWIGCDGAEKSWLVGCWFESGSVHLSRCIRGRYSPILPSGGLQRTR